MQGRFSTDPKKFDEVIQELTESGKQFEDPDFPAADESIVDPTDQTDALKSIGKVVWRRPKDIPALLDKNGKAHLFHGKIEPNDIKQGMLGDCYFLSALAALAEKPNRIRDMFLDEEVNNEGIYGAKMYKNGIEMYVNVDDFIPLTEGDRVSFARSNGPELWVIMLEKMWAKLHGSYERCDAGWEHHTIRDLTGAPAYFMHHNHDFDVFEKILDFDKKNYVMNTSMGANYDP